LPSESRPVTFTSSASPRLTVSAPSPHETARWEERLPSSERCPRTPAGVMETTWLRWLCRARCAVFHVRTGENRCERGSSQARPDLRRAGNWDYHGTTETGLILSHLSHGLAAFLQGSTRALRMVAFRGLMPYWAVSHICRHLAFVGVGVFHLSPLASLSFAFTRRERCSFGSPWPLLSPDVLQGGIESSYTDVAVAVITAAPHQLLARYWLALSAAAPIFLCSCSSTSPSSSPRKRSRTGFRGLICHFWAIDNQLAEATRIAPGERRGARINSPR